MTISLRARVLLSLGLVLSLLGFAVVVELGISAGRIHSGVTVAGFDVGGLTEAEAVDSLREHAERLAEAPLTFGVNGGLLSPVTPIKLGWRPEVEEIAFGAVRVGRDHAPFGALADRIDAWFSGVNLQWRGKLNPVRVRRLLNRWEKEASELGYQLDRARLRGKLKRAVVTWPRREFRAPLT